MIPEAFKERMKSYFSEGYEEFISALTEEDAVKGVRINSIKCNKADFFESEHSFSLEASPYAENGYILTNENESIGTTPEHHSGAIYVQDPGAMAALSAIKLQKGARVLDACAAPGGKSGQAAAMIGDEGVLYANEFVAKRAKILVSNLERLGVRSAIITSLDTGRLGEMFSAYFDLTIVDAPCSGEGMFRKSAEAIEEWSPENILHSAKRQREILENLADTVKPGGHLLYSTCTYSLEENEMQIDSFLSDHPDYKLVPVREELRLATTDGINFEGATHDMTLARRCYPHKTRGEGQFVALLLRTSEPILTEKISFKDASLPPRKDEAAIANAFFAENLISSPPGDLRRVGENLVILPHGCIVPDRSVFLSGVLLGEIRGKLLIPSHQFFSAFGKLFKRREELSSDKERLFAYLRGEEIEARGISGSGFCSVEYLGCSIGGGKASSGRIKNHYPKGLRNKK